MHWWEKEPLRIIEIVDCFDLKKLSAEELAKTVRKLGGNVQHFHCMELSKKYGSGLDDRSLYFKTSVSRVENPDRLAEYIPYARKYKIRVVVYFNVHWYTPDFAKRQPDWVQVKEDGIPVQNVYDSGTSFCINSPYRDWVFQILKDLCRYEIDGIFYDGPIFFSNTCYCKWCQKLFYEKSGKNLPPKTDRKNPLWKDLIEFQAESMETFLAESNKIIKGINPEILFYMNCNSNWPYWPTGRDNHRIIKHTDILGAEGGFLYGDLNRTPIFKPALTGKLLFSQSKNKPVVVFDCAGHKPWSWYILPETEISILLYETCFSGSNYWMAVFPDDINQPEMKAISEFGNFIKKHPEPFHKTKSLARVALVWPAKSAELYAGSSVPLTDFTSVVEGEEIGDLHMEFEGFYHALSKNCVPFDVIDENNFDSLKRYDLLILPNAACLSSEDCEKIRSFVSSGGNIVAGFESSLYDQNGKRRKDFGISDVLGVRFAGKIIGPMNHDYVFFEKDRRNIFLKNITKTYIPAPKFGVLVEAVDGKTDIFFCEKLKGRYDGVPEPSKNPMMVVNNYGKGCSIYFAGNIGWTIANFGFFEYFKIIKNITGNLSRNFVFIEENRNIEVFLRKNRNRVYIYLINLTSGLKRPFSFMQPLNDVKITLRHIEPISIKALKAGKNLKYEKAGRTIKFTIPYLDGFEIIDILTGEEK